MSKILELLSKPFIVSNYFQNNERMIIDKESFEFLIAYSPFNKITNYQLGHLEASLVLKEKQSDEQVINILHKINNHEPVRVSFLDIALHIEKKFELEDYGNFCEVVYVGVRDGELFSVSIEAVETDRKNWRIKLSSSRFDKEDDPPLWQEKTVFLLKKTY